MVQTQREYLLKTSNVSIIIIIIIIIIKFSVTSCNINTLRFHRNIKTTPPVV
jgi:hypothetical protein